VTECLFIVNPVSGGGKFRKLHKRLYHWIGRELPDASWETTEYPGHATKIAASAARRGIRAIFSVGGDGTLHEVVQAIAPLKASQQPAVGVLAAGTGADYARRLRELHGDISDWNWLKHPKTIKVDLGRASFRGSASRSTKRFFLNIADAGLGGESVRQMAQGGFDWGPLKYLIAALRAAWSYRPPPWSDWRVLCPRARDLRRFSLPAARSGTSGTIPTVEAWARWRVPKASFK